MLPLPASGDPLLREESQADGCSALMSSGAGLLKREPRSRAYARTALGRGGRVGSGGQGRRSWGAQALGPHSLHNPQLWSSFHHSPGLSRVWLEAATCQPSRSPVLLALY